MLEVGEEYWIVEMEVGGVSGYSLYTSESEARVTVEELQEVKSVNATIRYYSVVVGMATQV